MIVFLLQAFWEKSLLLCNANEVVCFNGSFNTQFSNRKLLLHNKKFASVVEMEIAHSEIAVYNIVQPPLTINPKVKPHMSTVSLIIPIYQAEDFIESNLTRIVEYCKKTPQIKDIVLVNDGSTDRTHSLIETFLQSHNKYFTYISLKTNMGKGAAIKAGITTAKSDYIIFTDCDLPYAFSNIDHIITQLIEHRAQVVVGSRMHPNSLYHIRPQNLSYIYIRHTSGRFFNKLVKLSTGLKMEDTQAGLKGFDRETAHLCLNKMTIEGFAFDIDLLTCANQNKKNIVEIPLEFNYDSEMSTLSFFKHAILMSFALLRICFKRMTHYYTRPC